jgi:ABC-type Fe3+ transport system permease subunit/DNA-binding beta-propeller fold protein YncE
MNCPLLINSLLVGGLATVLAFGMGFAAALWATGLPRRARNLLLAAAVIALALPPFLVTNCWLDLLGFQEQWRGKLLIELPRLSTRLKLDVYSLGYTVWILSLLLWPITLLAVLSAWQRLEPSHLECEPLLRRSALVRWLLVPMARGELALAAVLTFVLALNNFAVPTILQTKVFTAEVWVSFNTTFDHATALALSWPLLAAPLLLLWWLNRRSVSWPRLEGRVPPPLFRRQLGASWCGASAVVALAALALSVALPLTQLAWAKRTWTELPAAVAAGGGALANSVLFAALAGLLVVGLGLLTWRWRIGTVVWVPFLAPGVLLGIALIFVFNRPVTAWLYQTFGLVLLAFTARYLAVGWSGAAHALRSVDRDLTDAARLDGASGWQLFRHVRWPQVRSQLAAAWYLTYLLCLWDVETLVLIVPPGGETLALRVFNLLHYGHNAQVNALCLVLLALAVAPLAVWWIADCGMRLKSSKFQVPSSKEAPSSKLQAPSAMLRLGTWSFFGGWSLVVGASLSLSGCGGESSSTETVLDSRLFSRVQIIGTRGTAAGQFNKPRSLAVDKHDNLYVVDMTGRVQKFSPDGQFLLAWQMPQTDKGKAKGMCRDTDGNIVVIEPHYARVNHFSPDGKLVRQWGSSRGIESPDARLGSDALVLRGEKGTNVGQLAFPRAAAVNSRGEILVSEYSMVERVQQFTPDGRRCLRSIGRPGLGPGEFNRAEGIGTDRQDRLYVADSCNHRIQVFSPDGQFLRAYGRAGTGRGELSYPYDVQVDAAGRQYVCEFGNSRIQIFDAQDQPLEILGGPGAAPGRLNNPWAIALDSKGNLYVADSLNHRVLKFIRKHSSASSQWSVASGREQLDTPSATSSSHNEPEAPHRPVARSLFPAHLRRAARSRTAVTESAESPLWRSPRSRFRSLPATPASRPKAATSQAASPHSKTLARGRRSVRRSENCPTLAGTFLPLDY